MTIVAPAKSRYEALTDEDVDSMYNYAESYSYRDTEACRDIVKLCRELKAFKALVNELSTDENFDVRCAVAKNPSTPVAILEKLSADSDFHVRIDVAQNPSTPVAILERLSTDKAQGVRGGVAFNPLTPMPILEKLSTDVSVLVRCSVPLNSAWIACKE